MPETYSLQDELFFVWRDGEAERPHKVIETASLVAFTAIASPLLQYDTYTNVQSNLLSPPESIIITFLPEPPVSKETTLK